MALKDFFLCGTPTLSFEFFPPRKEEALQGTYDLIQRLSVLRPHFMTVTYGAGGGTRALTRKLVDFIHNELQIPAVAHLTCVNHSVAEIDEILDLLSKKKVTNILALRGDPPGRQVRFEPHPEGFSCARDLVAHISARGGFSVGVAGYPEKHAEAASMDEDIRYLKEKVDAGAEAVFTQLFFEPDVYFRFVEQARRVGIHVPIVPGVMPISSKSQLTKFTAMCGATIPKQLRDRLEFYEDNSPELVEFGIEFAVELSRALVEGGAPGVHLYTLNKSLQAMPIVERLNLGHRTLRS